MKKIAQSCPNCKEFFITKERLDNCPFCNEILSKKEKSNSFDSKQKTSRPSDISDIINEFLNVQDEVQSIYNLVYGFLSKNNQLIKSKSLDSEKLCDFGFICRELENLFDELRKEVKARKDLCGNIIAYRLIQESVSNPSSELKIKGKLATGTPDVIMQAALPKKFSEDYYKLTDFFKVPRNVAESGILKLDWKSCVELLTELTSKGTKIPDGFGKKYPLYKTTFRKRNTNN
jgi:hypothetical protein